MQLHRVILGASVALALAAPAQAQQSADPSVDPPFALQDSWGPTLPDLPLPKPNAKQLAAERGAENPGVTSAAKRTYVRLASGTLDRAKLTDDVSKALPTPALRSAAEKLGALGTPSWSFVGNAQSSAGDVSIYKLQYPAGVEYMTFGVGSNGTVYALYIGPKPTPAI
jgi:hypothetical protein